MVTYEYKTAAICDYGDFLFLNEIPNVFANSALRVALGFGANIVRDLVQEGNVVKNGIIVQKGEFASVQISGPPGESADSSDKVKIDPAAIYLLTKMTYLPSEKVVLFTNDNQRILIDAGVCDENSQGELEARVWVMGEEEVLKRFKTLITEYRRPRIINDEL